MRTTLTIVVAIGVWVLLLYNVSFNSIVYSAEAPCTLKLQGDANCDGAIKIDDFAIWRSEFLKTLATKLSDFDSNGIVAIADFARWRTTFLGASPTNPPGPTNTPVPETSPTPVPTTPPGGEVVPIPASPGPLTLVSRPAYYMGNRVNCSTKEPICAFGWQESDVYEEPRHQSYPAKVEWRNVQTGAVVKTVNLPDLVNAPVNGARMYPIYNPDNDNWFVVYHASRKSGPTGDNQTSIYGALFDAKGTPKGDVIEIFDGNFSGWVPHGYYDSSSKLFYMEWHQQTSSLGGRKDITAALVDGVTGALVKTENKLHNTPENLEEYSGSAFNSVRGEGMSLFAANTGACDEGCLTKATINRHTTSRTGVTVLGSQIEIDNNAATFEWYISLAFNPTTKRYLAVYGQSNTPYRGGPPISVKARILDMDGTSVSGELALGQASSGTFYWQTGSSCSTHNNLCVVAFKEKALYIDSSKSDTTAVGSVFNLPTGGGTAKVAYQPITKQFVLFGPSGYTLVNGK